MKTTGLKIFFLLLISTFIFFFHSDNTRGCGPEYIYDDFYQIFEQKLFALDKLEPFMLTEYMFHNIDEDGSIGPRFDNLKAWLEYFENKPTIDDLEKFIYSTKPTELLSLKNNQLPKENSLNKNTVILKTNRKKLDEAIDYLLFAKECEPYVYNPNPWEEMKRNKDSMNVLLFEAIKLYETNKTNFFKERYAYQAIRLAHYSQQYEKTISLFDRFYEKSQTKNLMYYWSLSHYAGAIKSIGNVAKANVLFARVFDNCPSRSRQSIISSPYYNDSTYEATLNACENNHDKVVVYALSAYKEEYRTLSSIQEIYKLEPQSDYLKLLLSRFVGYIEREYLPGKSPYIGYKEFLNSGSDYDEYFDTSEYNIIYNIADEKKTQESYLWSYAAGYIASVVGSPELSEKYFVEAKINCPKDNLDYIKRIQIAELICKVNSLTRIDTTDEAWLYSDMKWLKETESLKNFNSEDAFLYIMNTLAKKYWVQEDTLKSHFCFGFSGKNTPWEKFFSLENPFGYDIQSDYHIQPVEEIYKVLKENDPYETSWYDIHINNWMKFLMTYYYYNYRDLETTIAKKYLSMGRFEETVEKLHSHYSNDDFYNRDADITQKFLADPFLIHIKDCHDCDYMIKNKTVYTLRSFAQRMVELKNLSESEKDNEKLSEYYFQLANGYYNITYYGNSWIASSFNTRGMLNKYFIEGENFDFYDCSKAEKYYLLAAKKTENKEFAAKCYFMAAKCEQNTFYNTEHPQIYEPYMKKIDSKEPIKNEKYRTYFAILKDKYSNTEFYQQALIECKYFNNFVKENK